MSDGYAHRLPRTFGPRPMVLQTDDQIVVVRWQGLVKVSRRGRAAVRVTCKERVLSVLVKHLFMSTSRI